MSFASNLPDLADPYGSTPMDEGINPKDPPPG
jgi:hypothetical protein